VARLADGTIRREEVSYQTNVVCGRISKLEKKCSVSIKLMLHYLIFQCKEEC